MNIAELLLLALGLSMDAFAVSVSNGMCIKKIKISDSFSIAFSFGLAQGLMPLLGFYLGQVFIERIKHLDHYIVLILLTFIGVKMILEKVFPSHKEKKECPVEGLRKSELLLQAVATSIDALAAGVSFAAMRTDILISVGIIALITFCVWFVGVRIGKRFGDAVGSWAEIAGGLILILLGLKVFIEHVADHGF